MVVTGGRFGGRQGDLTGCACTDVMHNHNPYCIHIWQGDLTGCAWYLARGLRVRVRVRGGVRVRVGVGVRVRVGVRVMVRAMARARVRVGLTRSCMGLRVRNGLDEVICRC